MIRINIFLEYFRISMTFSNISLLLKPQLGEQIKKADFSGTRYQKRGLGEFATRRAY